MLHIRTTLAALLSFLLIVGTGCQTTPNAVLRLQAENAIRDGHFDVADQRTSLALEQDPSDWKALYYQGLIRIAQDRPLEARIALEQAFEVRRSRPGVGDIADALVSGAIAAIEKGGATYERIEVPGAFELPAALAMAIDAGRYDGFIALGCVIRGETTHYDYVCGESARGLNELAMRHRVALGYGVVTVENQDQAWARAAPDQRNKGGDVARACLAMIALRQRLAGNTQ